MTNPEENPVQAALEDANRRTKRSGRRAVILSAIALAAGGELIHHEIENGWSQDAQAIRDETIASFAFGLALGTLFAHRDNRRISKHREAMHKRSQE